MQLNLQKAGGIASLIITATYLFGFALFILVLDQSGNEGLAGRLRFALDNWAVLTTGMIALYLICGSALMVLAFALHQRFKVGAGEVSLVALGFGVAWATVLFASGMVSIVGLRSVAEIAATDAEAAATIWATVGIIQNGLGGGIEFVGGVWSVLVGILALKTSMLARPLGWLAIVLGIIGVATAWPQAEYLTAVFGIGQIVWFAWLGYALLRSHKA